MKGKNATNPAPDTVAALPQELRRRWNGANQVLIWKPRSKIWKGPTQLQFHLFISFTSLLQFVCFHLFSKLCLSVLILLALFYALFVFRCMLIFLYVVLLYCSSPGQSVRKWGQLSHLQSLGAYHLFIFDCGLAIVIVCFLLQACYCYCYLFVCCLSDFPFHLSCAKSPGCWKTWLRAKARLTKLNVETCSETGCWQMLNNFLTENRMLKIF